MSFRPEVGSQETISVSNGHETSLEEISLGTGATTGGGVTIIDTGQGQKTLGNGGSDNTGTTGSRDDTASGRTTFTSDLAGNGVGITENGSPVSTTHGNDGEFGKDDGTTDGSSNFL